MKVCRVCGSKARCKELCSIHYDRWIKTGRLDTLPRPSLEERFWSKVDKTETCWVWTGARTKAGYGNFFRRDRGHQEWVGAHRMAWELLVGPIPDDLEIDPRCRNTVCVNPRHLEVVTPKVNMARSTAAIAARVRGAMHVRCPNGHEYPMTGPKRCRPCMREADKRCYARKSERVVLCRQPTGTGQPCTYATGHSGRHVHAGRLRKDRVRARDAVLRR